MPRSDAGVSEPGLGVAAVVELGVLLNGSLKVSAILARRTAHPLLDGGGGNDGDTVGLGRFQSGEELVRDRGFVPGIHGVGAAHHEDEIELEVEILESVADLVEVLTPGAGDDRNLHAVEFDAAEFLELFHLGENDQFPVAGAWDIPVVIGNDSPHPSGVGGDDPEFNVGLVDDVSHDAGRSVQSGRRWSRIAVGILVICYWLSGGGFTILVERGEAALL